MWVIGRLGIEEIEKKVSGLAAAARYRIRGILLLHLVDRTARDALAVNECGECGLS